MSSLLSRYKAVLHGSLVNLLMLEADGQVNDHAEQWWQPQTWLGELLLSKLHLYMSLRNKYKLTLKIRGQLCEYHCKYHWQETCLQAVFRLQSK